MIFKPQNENKIIPRMTELLSLRFAIENKTLRDLHRFSLYFWAFEWKNCTLPHYYFALCPSMEKAILKLKLYLSEQKY